MFCRIPWLHYQVLYQLLPFACGSQVKEIQHFFNLQDTFQSFAIQWFGVDICKKTTFLGIYYYIYLELLFLIILPKYITI